MSMFGDLRDPSLVMQFDLSGMRLTEYICYCTSQKVIKCVLMVG